MLFIRYVRRWLSGIALLIAAPSAAQGTPATTKLQLSEVMTTKVGDTLVAGHVIEIAYRVVTDGVQRILTVERVKSEHRREAYRAKLDSNLPGDLVRVRGGAETSISFEAVAAFALLGQPLRLTLGDNGNVTAIEGGDAVRASMLAMFPPAPRKAPRTKTLIALRLSDSQLLERLWPAGRLLPADGALTTGRRINTDTAEDLGDYQISVAQATMLKRDGRALTLISKRINKPSTRPSAAPPGPANPTELRAGDRVTRLEVHTDGHSHGTSQDRAEVTWTGKFKGEAGTYLLFVETNRVWRDPS